MIRVFLNDASGGNSLLRSNHMKFVVLNVVCIIPDSGPYYGITTSFLVRTSSLGIRLGPIIDRNPVPNPH